MKIQKTDNEWQNQLSEQEYHVARECGTEAPFSGKFYNYKGDGIYSCVCCNAPLFKSDTKFDSGTGWPSYYEAIENAITEIRDTSHGMVRVEVRCSSCDAHLGHLFEDGVNPTGLRYCINSVCLNFKEEKQK